MSTTELTRVIETLDVEKAECLMPEDKAMILNNIRTHHGSSTAFDTALKLQLLLAPLSYKVDLEQLEKRSKGTVWTFQVLKDWINGDWSQGPRAFCLLAGAATGKSTIFAAILRHVCGSHVVVVLPFFCNQAHLLFPYTYSSHIFPPRLSSPFIGK